MISNQIELSEVKSSPRETAKIETSPASKIDQVIDNTSAEQEIISKSIFKH
jgi:hypothetical protein